MRGQWRQRLAHCRQRHTNSNPASTAPSPNPPTTSSKRKKLFFATENTFYAETSPWNSRLSALLDYDDPRRCGGGWTTDNAKIFPEARNTPGFLCHWCPTHYSSWPTKARPRPHATQTFPQHLESLFFSPTPVPPSPRRWELLSLKSERGREG